jgi:hypothetical protein
MQLSTTREATGCEATRQFPSILWNPKGSSPNSQELYTCPYPEPDQSSPHHPIPPLQDPYTHTHIHVINKDWSRNWSEVMKLQMHTYLFNENSFPSSLLRQNLSVIHNFRPPTNLYLEGDVEYFFFAMFRNETVAGLICRVASAHRVPQVVHNIAWLLFYEQV